MLSASPQASPTVRAARARAEGALISPSASLPPNWTFRQLSRPLGEEALLVLSALPTHLERGRCSALRPRPPPLASVAGRRHSAFRPRPPPLPALMPLEWPSTRAIVDVGHRKAPRMARRYMGFQARLRNPESAPPSSRRQELHGLWPTWLLGGANPASLFAWAAAALRGASVRAGPRVHRLPVSLRPHVSLRCRMNPPPLPSCLLQSMGNYLSATIDRRASARTSHPYPSEARSRLRRISMGRALAYRREVRPFVTAFADRLY